MQPPLGDADGFPAWSSIATRRRSSCSRAARAPIACATSSWSCCSRPCPSSRTRSWIARRLRKLEKLEPIVETIRGAVDGPVLARDGDLLFEVDVFQGHKTGHYLDQSLNRRAAAQRAEGGRVLDAFSYDGLFGLHAALAGAEQVVCLEQNKGACERILANAERNGLLDRIKVERVDCMKDMRARAEREERYELVVVDPPAFARSKKEVAGAERGYVELNRRAFDLVPAGGAVVSASCSYNVSPADFVKFIGRAANLSGRDVWLEELTKAAPDHPHLVTLPESDYLKSPSCGSTDP